MGGNPSFFFVFINVYLFCRFFYSVKKIKKNENEEEKQINKKKRWTKKEKEKSKSTSVVSV